MAKRTKVPRASIACTILDDPDFIGLMLDDSGRQAFALFCALLAAAKAQDNDGKFIQGSAIIAVMVRWPLDRFNASLADLTERTDWVASTDVGVTIRSFRKWNSWGGKRDSSGAPSDNQNARKNQSSADARINQAAPKIQPNMVTPVSVSVTDSVPETNDLKDKTAPKARVELPDLPSELLPYKSAIDDWLQYKRERREPYKPAGLKACYSKMVKIGTDLPAVLETAMANGWRGFDFVGNGKRVGYGDVRGVAGRGFESRASQGDKFAKLDGRA